MPTPTFTPSPKRAGRATNSRRTHFVGKLQSKRKPRRVISRREDTQLSGDESDSIDHHGAAQNETDPIAHHRPAHDEVDGTARGQPTGYEDDPGLMGDIISNLLGFSQPGARGGPAPSNAGPGSLLNTLAMMGIPLQGPGGPSPGIGGGSQPQGLVQARPQSLQMDIGAKLNELARVKAELAQADQRALAVQQRGPPKFQIPTYLPSDETFQENPLSASILDLLAVVHSLRDMRGLQIDVEGSLAMRLEELGDSEDENDIVKPNILDFQRQLEEVRALTEKQLEILDAFAKKAEGTIAAIQGKAQGMGEEK